MNKKVINVSFQDKSLSRIAGNPFGREIWKSVSGDVDWEGLNTIIFPDYLRGISTSFVQGFIFEICQKIGIEKLHHHFEFKCNNPRIEKKINESIGLTYIPKI